MRIVFIRHAQSYNNQLWEEVLADHLGRAKPAEKHYDQIRSVDPGISDLGSSPTVGREPSNGVLTSRLTPGGGVVKDDTTYSVDPRPADQRFPCGGR